MHPVMDRDRDINNSQRGVFLGHADGLNIGTEFGQIGGKRCQYALLVDQLYAQGGAELMIDALLPIQSDTLLRVVTQFCQ